MGVTSEIYLTKSNVSKEEWFELIKTISNYNGFLKKWKIIITNNKNEIKNKGTLLQLEIAFLKLYEDKIKTSINYYLNKNDQIKKYHALLALPTNILTADFEGNKRYFYKASPKYLDINKILHLLSSDASNAILSIDTFPYLQGNFYLNQNNFSFDKHTVIFGSSGTGKSKLISLLINNINKNASLKSQYKIVVIDPHASLENDIGGLGKVIDFNNNLDSIDLFMNNSKDTVATTEVLLDLFKSLLADQYNSKLERVLRHSLHLLLTAESFNFTNLRKLLLDLEYRNNLIRKLKYNLPISVMEFFLTDFNELKTKSYGEAISPIIGFIDEMQMLPVFNSNQNNDNLNNTLKNNFLTLFSLDRTKLGDKVTKTIAGLIMQQLLTIVQKREMDEHIIFIIDEVAIIENPILARFLSETRKYNLSLILAGQYFNQISEELKNSIFANVINYFIFRVSKLDANVLVDNFNMKIPLDDSKERKVKLLTELNNRECVARIEANGILLPAFKGTTLDFISIPRMKKTDINNSNTIDENNAQNNTNFKINTNINLKDILIANSTGKKGV